MAYTGYKIQPTLKKVTNDVNEFPLDINNDLCSVSGLPQDTMPNPEFDPTYRVEDDACDPILYESRAMTEYFMKDCGDDEYSNNVPFSTTLAQFTSYISQEDADNQAWAWLMENGQANADSVGTCSTTYCNEPETRVFFSTTCSGYPEPYYVTIPANTFCDTDSDVVIADVDSWFATNGQSQADINGTCKTGDTPSIFYKVTGDPCTSERTAIKVYYKNSEDKYYTDEAMTIEANFYFFLTDSTLGAFRRIIDGVLSNDLEYAQCEAPETPFRYDDMGTPADISFCCNKLLACYPDKHVVAIYDTSTGTNPIGTIVAGRLNVQAEWEVLAPDPDSILLNNPMMVEWILEDDGLTFAVYSGGAIKSIKVFKYNPDDNVGELKGTTNFTSGALDGEWKYINTSGLEPQDYSSLVGLLTPQDSSLNNFWMPVSMSATRTELGEETGSLGYTIFLGLWNKTGAINKYRVYATTLYNFDESPVDGYTSSLTLLINNNEGYSTGGNDLIRDMDILRTDFTTVPGDTTHRLVIATPYAAAKSKANDKIKHYNLHYIDVTISRGLEYNVIYDIGTLTNIGDFRNNTSTNGIWKNNLKAEINVNCGSLYVYIKSSNDSVWNILLRTASVPLAAGLVGIVAGLSLHTIIGWFTCVPCLIMHGAALGPATILIGAIISIGLVIATWLFSPPPQRYLGGSAIVFTYSGDSVNITGSTYVSGSYTSQSWITNKIDKPRTIYMDSCNCDDSFYSMPNGREIKQGQWNSSSPYPGLITCIPCDLEISFVSKTDETTPGGDDGTITITGSTSFGGGFVLSKNNGSTFPYTGTSPYTFTGLAPGTYNIKARNADGTCTVGLSESVVIDSAVSSENNIFARFVEADTTFELQVIAEFNVTSDVRVKTQLHGINGEIGSPDPEVYVFINSGHINGFVSIDKSNINLGAWGTIEIVEVLTGTPPYPTFDDTYSYTYTADNFYR